MSINKVKLYVYYYGNFSLIPVFFLLCFVKGMFDAFFDSMSETIGAWTENKREFERRKNFTDNQ